MFMSSSKVSWIPFDTSNAAMIPVSANSYPLLILSSLLVINLLTFRIYACLLRQSLATLCKIIRNACETLAPLVSKLYYAHNAESSKLKSDFSLFTIADGVVQVNCQL